MALKSIKDKISNMAGGEILGEGNMEREQNAEQLKEVQHVPPPRPAKASPKSKKIKNDNNTKNEENKIKNKNVKDNVIKKPRNARNLSKPKQNNSKQIKSKENKTKKTRMFGIKEKERKENLDAQKEEFEIVSSPTKTKRSDEVNIIKDAIEGYEDVLSILGIREHIELDVDFKSNQLDYVEFTQTQPLGFDFDEVTDFISRTKYTMYKLESALAQREIDVVRIASEVKKVEQKMIEANHEKELERMIGGMTQEEILIEENMELKVQVNDLTRKLNNVVGNSGSIKELNKQIEILRAENDILKISNVEGKLLNKLPSMGEFEENNVNPEDKNDEFGEMLNAIGGLYDE